MLSIILPSGIFYLAEPEWIKNEGAEYLQVEYCFFLSCYDDDATKLVEEASRLFSVNGLDISCTYNKRIYNMICVVYIMSCYCIFRSV